MPTLTRILALLAVIAAIAYGAMLALASFVEPTPHQITVEIPASKIRQTVIAPPPPPPVAAPAQED
ncbi:recombinase [Falsochrobactrum sp. TDYN1]|uniref:Recombinase n=1 Tax=Falsochrobactrum tianjinense TaxID=2706015 RepID=A0A949PJM0_9HYPH|nr:recombinase [Falsochrobactrum sp. TDYN1]MBV2141997.1 recombinase [Falsochrobactrum sp. TDYN1]